LKNKSVKSFLWLLGSLGWGILLYSLLSRLPFHNGVKAILAIVISGFIILIFSLLKKDKEAK